MSKITYTKTQLRGFSLEELKSLELYSKVEDKKWTKTELIDALLDAQSNSTEEEVEVTEEKKPVVFHRKKSSGFNPMSFRRK